MSITLIDLVNFLTSKTTNINHYINSLKQIKKLDNIVYNDFSFLSTNFSYGDTLDNLLFCLIYNKVIPGFDNCLISNDIDQYERNIILLNDKIICECRNNIINYINDEQFNFPFSKKKIITLINNNNYNHEIILILCKIYNVNIFIFYKDINLFKLYYPEEKLIIYKKNIFLQYNKDIYSSLHTFQNMFIKNNDHLQHIFKWSDIFQMFDICKKYIYPIGILENKELQIDDNINDNYNDELNKLQLDDTINKENNDINCKSNKSSKNTKKLKQFIFSGTKIMDIKTHKKILNCNPISII